MKCPKKKSKALPLKHGKGAHALIDSGLDSRSQTKVGPQELRPEVRIRRSDLNLCSLKKEMKMRGL